jgi:hypothetical protein
MSDDTYTPKAGSLAEKVCNYFRLNPSHILDIDTIAEDFGVAGSVVAALDRAVSHGLLARSHGGEFTAGPMLPDVVNPSVISQPKPRKGTGRGHSKLAHFDIDAIQVDKGVPIPSGTVRKKHESKWAPLLAKLTTKGDSVALPDQYRGTIDSYIRKLTKARPDKAPQFRTGRDDNGVTRIWRIA